MEAAFSALECHDSWWMGLCLKRLFPMTSELYEAQQAQAVVVQGAGSEFAHDLFPAGPCLADLSVQITS